jgi:FkbM family methyltransferase
MKNFFDKSLHYLGNTKQNITALNIGSMDGVMFDEMIGYTNMYNFKVLYVEPIPYLFDRLKNNISNDNALFENSAISDYDGEIEMLTIDREVIDSGLVHSCFYGMSAVYPPKNGLGSEFDKPTVDKYGQLVRVPCITFNTLMSRHNLPNFDILKVDAEGHDFKIFKQIDFNKYTPKVIRLEWINLTELEQTEIIEIFDRNNFIYEMSGQDIVGIPKDFYKELFSEEIPSINTSVENITPVINTSTENKIVTIVTGLWDIGRENLKNDWSRSYNHYLEKLDELLKIDNNLIIFGDEELQKHVMSIRNISNTQFILRNSDWFKDNNYYDKIQKIRTNPDWYNQVGWLKDSTQSKLEMYNPLVMSKVFLLNDAKIMDKFNSDYLFWLDAGITNTVHPGYFTHDKVINKLPKYINKFAFVTFHYDTTTEIHGFKFDEINKYAGETVKLIGRGGFFGGPKESIPNINSLYYNLLVDTLNNDLMGTEESLFSILLYKYPSIFNNFEIESNGLINKFFEDLKNDTLSPNQTIEIITTTPSNNPFNKNPSISNLSKTDKIGLYVIGFNSPKQLETLIFSMLEYDKNFIEKPRKILLDNSSDLSTTPIYSELCAKYGFEHIKKENLGICGGRQWIAEHFEKSDLEYMFFFEDDMFFYPKKDEVCRNGFNRMADNLYDKSINIIKQENFDYLKLNFSEFFGDNSVQWTWYNVPQVVREQYWPDHTKLPEQGTDPNAPKVKYENVKSYEGVPYVTGEIYYCNWPQLVSKSGSKKMFLETTWAHPYEQTWMSHMYQELKKGKLNFGLLLLTPTEHDRFDHYSRDLRKES